MGGLGWVVVTREPQECNAVREASGRRGLGDRTASAYGGLGPHVSVGGGSFGDSHVETCSGQLGATGIFFSLFFFAPFGRLHLLASSLKMLNCSLLCLALAVLFLRFDHANLWRILAIGPLKMIGLPAAGWMVVQ